ncbi:hypothetical protein [Yoonia sp. MH D7]
MVESSKILTVSYGTFSCTLEGFDDSFGTMKAIAEYFRDLAADDRYFGAEPPAPDVAMLAKIAEREITRRVDAHTQDGGIVLRASQAVAPAMPPQVSRPEPVQMATAAVAPQVAPTLKDRTLDDFQKALSDAAADETAHEATPKTEHHVSSPRIATPHALTFDDMGEVTHTAPAHPDSESVAAKLQRIRAVVGKSQEKSHEADFVEDLGETPMPVVPDAAEDAPVAEDTKVADKKPAIDMSDLDFSTPDASEESESLVEDAPHDAPETIHEDVAEDEADAPTDDDALLDGLAAKVAQSTPAAPDDAPQTLEKPAIRAQILRIRKTQLLDVTVEEPVDAVAAVDENFAIAQNIDDDDTDAEFGLDDDLQNLAILDGFEDLEGFDAPINTTLSDDDEADLMEELAEVERDFTPVQPQAAESQELATQKPRTTLPETDDATMSHILTQTDQQLSEPEGSRRRDAIAQLKAAVAATEAARQLGDKGHKKEETEDAFREDLKEVVNPTAARPTRVKPTDTRTVRPRPAPLKLVASQRVDAHVPATHATPVQPRRVAATAEPISPAAATNFAEFAEEMGATSLADLLEAAAAYTAFVEGVEDFSRPQIMKKVQSSTETEFSREDGLRSFGTLLRQGRISKVRNGRFQVSDASRFKPEAKAG